ncbi:MAG: beta-lactamase family protein [Clostridiales bacterium]|nr:beta-lactamase family protein [Clostridiales bacterium]
MERVTPASAGVSPRAVLGMLDALRRAGVETHSFMLTRRGKVCAEGWWKPFAPEYKHIMFSFSKSFTSTAIGFAEQEGLLSLDEKLADIFADALPENPGENLRKAEIKHLLTMTCGHEVKTDVLSPTDNMAADFMARPFVYEPGTHFSYNTAGTNMLCDILKRKIGKNLTEFLKPRLFEPLGMSDDIGCFTLPGGIEAGGFGYSIRTEDMARFIEFVANKGKLGEKQLLNADWFDRATAKQVENGDGTTDWGVGYGYQFWRCKPEGVYRGDGAYGQYGIVFPAYDATLVITSAELIMQDCLDAVWTHLLPGFNDFPVTGEEEAEQELSYRLKHLSLPVMPGFQLTEARDALNGSVFIPDKQYHSFTTIIGGAGCVATRYPVPLDDFLKSISFIFKDGKGYLECRQNSGVYALDLGLQGDYAVTDVNGVPFAVNSCWRSDKKLEVLIRNLNAASGRRADFEFEENKLKLNLDWTPPIGPGLAGTDYTEVTFSKMKAG